MHSKKLSSHFCAWLISCFAYAPYEVCCPLRTSVCSPVLSVHDTKHLWHRWWLMVSKRSAKGGKLGSYWRLGEWNLCKQAAIAAFATCHTFKYAHVSALWTKVGKPIVCLQMLAALHTKNWELCWHGWHLSTCWHLLNESMISSLVLSCFRKDLL